MISSDSSNAHRKEYQIADVSDYVLELIFTNLNPYQDFNNVLCVSKRWHRVGKTTLTRIKRFFYKCSNFSWRLLDEDLTHSHLLSERCSHATCYHPADQVMYMFGGCTNTYTAFNDLWSFDLSCRVWERVIISRPPLPSAKALASLVLYNDNLILYGGFSKSSTNPIHQTTTFFKEIHLFNKSRNCWEEIICENTAPHLAGHTASIVSDFMLVFGGSMGSSYNNNVYVLDIQRRIWNMPSISGSCPPPRYGQSQILLDDCHLVVIGGCGGPNVMFSDIWLLDFDLNSDIKWKWTQLKVDNLHLFPPYLWCHRACKVGKNAVVLSRPTKYNIRKSRRWRASSQRSSCASSHRISSPDSPQDRRAVAAAFCSAALEQSLSRRVDCTENKKKPVLFSSRSLDDQNQNNAHQTLPQMAGGRHLQSSGASSITSGNKNDNISGNSISKTSELYRACSIPAIIVGEIPKLIVTSSVDQQQISFASKLTVDGVDESRFSNSLKHTAFSNASQQDVSCSLLNYPNTLDASILNENAAQIATTSTNKFGHTDVVRQFYLSLIKEEHDRLKIVELAENLQVEEQLDYFLRERVPYLTTPDRFEMIDEYLHSNDADSDYSLMNHQRCQGRLNRSRGTSDSGCPPRFSIGSKISLNENDSRTGSPIPDSFSASFHRPSFSNSSQTTNSIFGQTYYRHMCVYVLHLQDAIKTKTVSWRQLPVEDDSPEDIILHSVVAARGELILFGGMQSDGGNGMDCLNVGMDRHMMNSDTFILKPRYNEM